MHGYFSAKSLFSDEGRDPFAKETLRRDKEVSMFLYLAVAVGTVLLAVMVENHPVLQPYKVTRQQMCSRVCLLSIFSFFLRCPHAGRMWEMIMPNMWSSCTLFIPMHMCRRSRDLICSSKSFMGYRVLKIICLFLRYTRS